MSYEMKGFTPEEARAKASREKDKQELQAKLARPKKPDPEALAAVQELDQIQLDSLRKKLAGLETPKEFPEGTGEIELIDDDLEEETT